MPPFTVFCSVDIEPYYCQLHFRSPRAYGEIFAIGSKFTKDPSFYQCFGLDKASFGTIDPHFSRARREVLLPMFSRRAILNLEWLVQEKVLIPSLNSTVSHMQID
jgi:hypothetical protein